jgi:hypothetical protein
MTTAPPDDSARVILRSPSAQPTGRALAPFAVGLMAYEVLTILGIGGAADVSGELESAWQDLAKNFGANGPFLLWDGISFIRDGILHFEACPGDVTSGDTY